MHTSATTREVAEARASSREGEGLVNAAGAAVGALGVVDLLLGISMIGAAATYDAFVDGAATAAAMRAYGVRVAFVGAVNLAFVWAVFAEAGARPAWLLLPLGLAASDVLGDVLALGAGDMPGNVLSVMTFVHELLVAAVAAAAISAWRSERVHRRRRAGAAK